MAKADRRADGVGFRVPTGGRVGGRLRPPPSKSLTNRYLNLALLAREAVELRHPSASEDARVFLAALQKLGFAVDRRDRVVRIAPGPLPSEGRLDCGNNGTMTRFLTAALTAVPGRWVVDGSPRLRERPVGPLVDALRALGAEIDYLQREGYPPLRIVGGELAGGRVCLDAGESSQYLSALLMVALVARRPTAVEVSAITSRPYVDLTLEAVGAFGGRVEAAGKGFLVEPSTLCGGELEVEPDLSAACYPAAAAVLTGGRVVLDGVRASTQQGDREFFELLGRLGAGVAWRQGSVEVWRRGGLTAVSEDLSRIPDQVPTLAALAPFAAGRTRITDVAHLRVKESDRLRAMRTELQRLGVDVEERPDGLEIEGVWASASPPQDPVVVSSHDDHRIAMSLALVGLRRPGITVARPEVVAKSYPGFWGDLQTILVDSERRRQGGSRA